ncbi:hypothetical protein [Scytonema millei]
MSSNRQVPQTQLDDWKVAGVVLERHANLSATLPQMVGRSLCFYLRGK